MKLTRLLNGISVGILFSVQVLSQSFLPVWEKGNMPNSKGLELTHEEARERITQVAEPGIYTFFTSKDENNNTAVLICPPGGYQKLTYQIAGFQLAKWFNTLGVNAFVLIYRLPTSPDLIQKDLGPIQDAQRAMQLIRSNAIQWNIDVNKIGVMGCSAGGHVAAMLSTWKSDETTIHDSISSYSFQPNFQILVSPVITMGQYTHAGSKNALLGETPSEETIKKFSCEENVTNIAPSSFIVHASDDHTVSPINSILYYKALLNHNVSASLHIFPSGGHSIALRNNPGSTELWSALCEAWMKEIGVLRK